MKFDVALQREIESGLDLHIESSNHMQSCEAILESIEQNILEFAKQDFKLFETTIDDITISSYMNESMLSNISSKIGSIFQWIVDKLKQAWNAIRVFLKKSIMKLVHLITKVSTFFTKRDFSFDLYTITEGDTIKDYCVGIIDVLEEIATGTPIEKIDSETYTKLIDEIKKSTDSINKSIEAPATIRMPVYNGIVKLSHGFNDDETGKPLQCSTKEFLSITKKSIEGLEKDSSVFSSIIDEFNKELSALANKYQNEMNDTRNLHNFDKIEELARPINALKPVIVSFTEAVKRYYMVRLSLYHKTLASYYENTKDNVTSESAVINNHGYHYSTITLEMILEDIKNNHKIFEEMMMLDAIELKYKNTKFVNEKGITAINEASLDYIIIKFKEIFKWLKDKINTFWEITITYFKKAVQTVKKFINKAFNKRIFDVIEFEFDVYTINEDSSIIEKFKKAFNEFIPKNVYNPIGVFEDTTDVTAAINEYIKFMENAKPETIKYVCSDDGRIRPADSSKEYVTMKQFADDNIELTATLLDELQKIKGIFKSVIDALSVKVETMKALNSDSKESINAMKNAVDFKTLCIKTLDTIKKYYAKKFECITLTGASYINAEAKAHPTSDKHNEEVKEAKNEYTIYDLDKELTSLYENTFIDNNDNVFIYENNNLRRSI